MRYVSTGVYYGRVKVNGKIVKKVLGSKVFNDAKLLLHDWLHRESKRRHIVGAPSTVGEAKGFYEASLERDPTLRRLWVRFLHAGSGLIGVKPLLSA